MQAELSRATAPCAGVRYTKDGAQTPVSLCIINQHVVQVVLNGNGTPWHTITCSPTQLTELVLGRLATEGRIASAAQVASIAFSQEDTLAEVTLAHCQSDAAGALCNVAAPTQGAQAVASTAGGTPNWQPAWVFALQELLAAEHPLYQKTHGCHSCTIAKEGEVLYICEDISRHNALDKAIGCALRDGVHLGECMVYSSGRAPKDMLQKAICAGVRCYVSKAVPTAQGVALAKQAGITLICGARGGSFTVVNTPND